MKKEKIEERKPLQEMTLLDNFLFREVMNVPELFKILVNIIMENPVIFLDKPQTEKVFGTSPNLRSIRVDVFNESMDKSIYALEMQSTDTKNLPKRSRYYQSHIDVKLLQPGERDFNELNEVYLIVICPFDLFGKEACKYTFMATCKEYPELKLEDGGYRMFINTKGKNREQFSDEFVELLDYINAPVEEQHKYTTTEAVRILHEGINNLKKSQEVNYKYMQLWEEIEEYKDIARAKGLEEGREAGRKVGLEEGREAGRIAGIAEGRAEGRAEGLGRVVEAVQNVSEKLGIPLEKACELTGITMENYNEYRKMYANIIA